MYELDTVVSEHHPYDGTDWTFYNTVYEELLICCYDVDFPTPEPTPAPFPTPEPSKDPSPSPTPSPATSEPTPSPTDSPTPSPTPSPVSSPTTQRPTDEPTTIPTTYPITSQPTSSPISPTPSPATSEPSTSPSPFPTTDQPTSIPTSPPLTSSPTPSPATSEPSTSPSTPPTTDEPTTIPTTPEPNMICGACSDTAANWKDFAGNDCTWYANEPATRCVDNQEARQICCGCNGGSLKTCDYLCDKHVTVSTCEDATSGTTTPPTVRVCSADGDCVEEPLASLEIAADGEVTVVVDLDDIDYEAVVEVCLTATGSDGMCIDGVMADYVPVLQNPPIWLDNDCQDTVCECDHYYEGHIFVDCQTTSGDSTLNLGNDDEVLIIVIPPNTREFIVQVTADVDMDLQLFAGADNNPECGALDLTECAANTNCKVFDNDCYGQNLVGYQGSHLASAGCVAYNGQTICFSGDQQQNPVTEQINIDATTETLSMYVHSFGEGSGLVEFSWAGIDPCPEDWGCQPCDQWVCKAPNVPYCDGRNHPVCMLPEEAQVLALQCDADQNTDNCENEYCFTVEAQCAPTSAPTTPEPTTSPSPVPTTDEPTSAPTTPEPTSSPSTYPTTDEPTTFPTSPPYTSSPSPSPTTPEPTTPPTTPEPTSSPTYGDCTDYEDECEEYIKCLKERLQDLQQQVDTCESTCAATENHCDSVQNNIANILGSN